jgi:sugar-specific transcriptional regulator TrmB
MDTKPLEKLGLQETEIKVYLALLKKGLSTATQISQYTALNRSHIYDKLDILLEKGLISFVIKNNVKYFNASDPEKIIDYLKEIQTNIQEIIPDLNQIKNIPKPKTIVELYQGKEGMKTVLKDIIREKKDYSVFGEEAQFQELLPVYIQQFLRDVKQNKMQERILSKEEKRGKVILTPKNTKIKYLPNRLFSPVTTAVYGNKTAIFIWAEPQFVVLIKDKGVAEAYNSYFNVLWEIARK